MMKATARAAVETAPEQDDPPVISPAVSPAPFALDSREPVVARGVRDADHANPGALLIHTNTDTNVVAVANTGLACHTRGAAEPLCSARQSGQE